REHTVLVSPSGLVTVTGGKWTTYRAMAEDVLEKCVESALLPRLPPSETSDFLLLGAQRNGQGRTSMAAVPGLDAYGTEAPCVQALPGAETQLAPGLSAAMVRFAVRYEYARTVEDVLARRSRMLFLDARLAATLAPAVAALMQEETGVDPQLDAFLQLTEQYLRLPS
ncbi:MAG TPA: glycerol-3-phosphate dehydrogenase C-terminal domain-containing protein, partial [Eoetvoesiella sp.]